MVVRVVVVAVRRHHHTGAQGGRRGCGKDQQGKGAFHGEAPVDCGNGMGLALTVRKARVTAFYAL